MARCRTGYALKLNRSTKKDAAIVRRKRVCYDAKKKLCADLPFLTTLLLTMPGRGCEATPIRSPANVERSSTSTL